MPVRFLSPAHYQSYGQYNGSPNSDQLSRYFYLNDFDRAQIQTRRGKINQIGFALELVTVRFLGTHLQDITSIPNDVHLYITDQLQSKLKKSELLEYTQSRTIWRHQTSINKVYGYRSFHEVEASYQFLRWLYTRVRIGSERPSILFDLSTAWLIDHKILLPGVTVLERLVSQVRDRVERRSWDLINRQLSHEQKQQIQYLISATNEKNVIAFDTIRQMPSHHSSPQIRFMLDRLEMLRSHQLQTINVSNLSPNRLKTLADYALTVSATTLKRLTLKRQTAVVLAGTIMLEIRIQDLILYMVEQGFHESVTRAKYKYKEDRLQSLAEFDQAAFQLRDFAQFLVELPDDESLTIPELFSLFQKQEIEASIASIDRVKYSESNNYRGLLVKYYRSIRRFLSLFLYQS